MPNTTKQKSHMHSWTNNKSSSRIDYVLTSANTYHSNKKTEYFTPLVNTNHKGIKLTLNFQKYIRGKGYYKVNNELYTDPDFLTKVNTMIDTTLIEQKDSPVPSTLDIILFNTCDIARQHTNQRNQEQADENRYLTTEIKLLKLN